MSKGTSKAYIVVDLGYGDCGKGTMTDYLCRRYEADMVVRYSGGAQCGHNVVLADGTHHEFRQLGSGTFAGAETYWSEYMMLNPITFWIEIAQLTKQGWIVPNMYAHREALVTTPFHMAMNRVREELRGDARHGSCGMGIGETMKDSLAEPHIPVIRVKDLQDKDKLRSKAKEIRDHKISECEDLGYDGEQLEHLKNGLILDGFIHDSYDFSNAVHMVASLPQRDVYVFEGSQGVLLDEEWGEAPHNTWSKTTTLNAEIICMDAVEDYETIGVMRAYQTRHGAGPLRTYDEMLTKAIPDEHNKHNEWQGDFRVGWLDLPLTKYALDCTNGVHKLAITCIDRMPEKMKVAIDCDQGQMMYEEIDKRDLARFVDTNLKCLVGYVSDGPTAEDKYELGVLS